MTPWMAPWPDGSSVAPKSTTAEGTKASSTHGVHEPILARNPPIGVLTNENPGPCTSMTNNEMPGALRITPDEMAIGSARAPVGYARNHSDTATAHVERRNGTITAPPGSTHP